jgi:peroxiredoxin
MRTFLKTAVLASAAASIVLAGVMAAADHSSPSPPTDNPAAAKQTTLRVMLQSVSQRQPAPTFSLIDSEGKTARLEDYRGKIVLLDFWATWCHGCKEEIPWFAAFSKDYESQGLAVVGVSLDEDGWKVLRPFLAGNPIPYRIVLGDEATSKRFGIESMPDTFLIDRDGKIAGAYRGGLVDRQDVDKNLKILLAH